MMAAALLFSDKAEKVEDKVRFWRNSASRAGDPEVTRLVDSGRTKLKQNQRSPPAAAQAELAAARAAISHNEQLYDVGQRQGRQHCNPERGRGQLLELQELRLWSAIDKQKPCDRRPRY